MQPFVSPQLAIIIMAAISVLLIAYGAYSRRRLNESSSDYLYAGRNVGIALSSATIIATWVTSNTVMAAPEQAYTLGVIGLIAYSLAGLALVLFAPLANRIKKLMPSGYSSGEFIKIRYGQKAWLIYMILATYYFLGFLVSQAMAGGLLLQALTGLDYKVGMLTIMVVCALYTIQGGLKAIFGTDFILCLLIMGALAVTAIFVVSGMDVGTIYSGVMADDPDRLNAAIGGGIMFLGSQVLFCCGEIFHSNIWWQRVHAAKARTAGRSFLVAGLIFIPIPVVAGMTAFVAIANNYDIPQVNMVFPIVASELLGAAGGVLVLIVVFSALAATISSILHAASNLLVHDIIRQKVKPDLNEDKAARYVKLTVLGLSLFTIAVAWAPQASIYQVLLLTGPAVASMIWPITYGIFNKKVNHIAVSWAMVAGMATGLAGYFIVSSYSAAIFSALTSGLVLVVATKLRPDSTFRWRDLAESSSPQNSQVPE